jgi:hypothetical protein
LGPRHRICSSDWSIKCSGTSRAPESKANPCHTGPLTPPGNHIPTLFDQLAFCGHPRCCAGIVREGRCHSMTLCLPLPYLLHVAPLKEDGGTLERGTTPPTPPRLGRRCDVRSAGRIFPVTSGPVRPSPPLRRHPRHCRAIPCTVGTQVDRSSPRPPYEASCLPPTKPSNWHTDDDQTRAPALLPSKPLDGHKIRNDACQRQDAPGWLSIPRHCTPCCRTRRLEPCGMTVNRLPLAYKRRRRSPGRGETTDSNSLAFPPSPTILALCLNQPSGTWRLLLLSYLACSSPIRAPQCLAIQRHECTPAGRTTHGRNQDKPCVIALLSAGHRETDLSTLTS